MVFLLFLYCVLASVIPTVILASCRRSSSRPSDDNREKAATVERSAKAAPSTVDKFFFSFDCCLFFHFHDSHLAAKRCGHEMEQGASSRTHF